MTAGWHWGRHRPRRFQQPRIGRGFPGARNTFCGLTGGTRTHLVGSVDRGQSALAREAVDARNISAIVSRELRALTQRACELAEQELGPPPLPYSMLVLGFSGPRREPVGNGSGQRDSVCRRPGWQSGRLVRQNSDCALRRPLDAAGVQFLRWRRYGIKRGMAPGRSRAGEREIGRWLSRTSPDGYPACGHLFRFNVCSRRFSACGPAAQGSRGSRRQGQTIPSPAGAEGLRIRQPDRPVWPLATGFEWPN